MVNVFETPSTTTELRSRSEVNGRRRVTGLDASTPGLAPSLLGAVVVPAGCETGREERWSPSAQQ